MGKHLIENSGQHESAAKSRNDEPGVTSGAYIFEPSVERDPKRHRAKMIVDAGMSRLSDAFNLSHKSKSEKR